MATAEIVLSPDQQAAHDAVLAWYQGGADDTLTFGGYAGTGKTSTIAAIVATLRARCHVRIKFCCFTGKASLVLRRKLERADVLHDDYCGTIHGLIYEPRKDEHGKLSWARKEDLEADLIVLDEASMVDQKLFEDLAGYGIPILAVGDHGQLPPISGTLNLMTAPVIRLEKIHRQADDNPIVQMSLRAREGKGILTGDYGAVRKVSRRSVAEVVARYGADFDAADLVLCGTNATRTALNHLLRARRGFEGPMPLAGERVICLRNDRESGVYNGLTGVLRNVGGGEGVHRRLQVDVDGGGAYDGVARLDQFGLPKTIAAYEKGVGLWDWGYALTVHKAQGSEAPNVIVFDECGWMETEDLRRRWKYTAYTRAAERLLIVG